jgi:hypothetical protein
MILGASVDPQVTVCGTAALKSHFAVISSAPFESSRLGSVSLELSTSWGWGKWRIEQIWQKFTPMKKLRMMREQEE